MRKFYLGSRPFNYICLHRTCDLLPPRSPPRSTPCAPIAYRAPMSPTRLIALSLLLASAAVSRAHADSSDEPVEEAIASRAPANEDSFTPGLTHASAVGRGIATATATL